MRLLSAVLLLSAVPVLAQDPAQLANQQILLQQQQIQQQQLQQQQTQQQLQQQQIIDQQTRLTQQALQNTTEMASAPQLRLSRGASSYGVEVRMKSRTRGAAIFYTTDGWTPTEQSSRYTGPVMLAESATVRAIAMAPGTTRSSVATMKVEIAGVTAAAQTVSPAVRVSALTPGVELRLVFTAAVSSHDVEVGDKLPVALADALYVGGSLVADQLMPVLATVTQVDGHGLAGVPGSITFAVHSLVLKSGQSVPLAGTETLEGRSLSNRVGPLALIPVVGIVPAIAVHGKEAVIPQGATLMARVAEDGKARLHAAQTQPAAQQSHP